MTLSRRSVLQSGAGALALSTVAGCLSEPGNGEHPEDGYAAFFALWDWTRQIAGEEMAVENPVETGKMGHGWDPPTNLQRNIANSAFFVYLDTPEFSWAQDIAADLESNTDQMTLIDGMDGLDDQLLPVDRHVWVDPVIAQTIATTIADGLVEVDPDNEDRYRENADAYRDDLDEIDRQFQELTENATRDVAVLAGHDSFQYLEDRYDFELRTPVGISPDEVESSADVSELISVIEDHGIETILYDPFEMENPDDDRPEMVDVLLDETDATESKPVTSAEGTTTGWSEQGYGWVEQMTEITIPSLEAALGTE